MAEKWIIWQIVLETLWTFVGQLRGDFTAVLWEASLDTFFLLYCTLCNKTGSLLKSIVTPENQAVSSSATNFSSHLSSQEAASVWCWKQFFFSTFLFSVSLNETHFSVKLSKDRTQRFHTAAEASFRRAQARPQKYLAGCETKQIKFWQEQYSFFVWLVVVVFFKSFKNHFIISSLYIFASSLAKVFSLTTMCHSMVLNKRPYENTCSVLSGKNGRTKLEL